MTVLTPTEYPVTFEDEEIDTLQSAAKVLQNIIKTMEKQNCNTLEGGYGECPYLFTHDGLQESYELLMDFCIRVPYNMY